MHAPGPVGCFIGMLACATIAPCAACAEFVGAGFVSLQAWNDAANNGGYADLANGGGPVTVWRLYAAFDGDSMANEDSVRVVTTLAPWSRDGRDRDRMSSRRALLDITQQFPAPSEPFFDARLEWDSFLTINIDDLANGDPAIVDGPGLTVSGVNSQWFLPNHDSIAQASVGTNAGADDFGTGLFLTMLGQFTVAGAPPFTGDAVFIRTDGDCHGVSNFSGRLKFNVGGSEIDEYHISDVVSCPGDFNLDNGVAGSDLADLLAAWGDSNPLLDLTGDGAIDGADLAVMLASWGSCQ